MPMCDCNRFDEIDRGVERGGATGQVNQSVSPCTTKIYKVLMQDIFSGYYGYMGLRKVKKW